MSIHYGPQISSLLGSDALYTRPETDPVTPEAKAEANEPLERDRIAIGTAGYPHFCEGMPPLTLFEMQRMRELPIIEFVFSVVINPILAGTRKLVIRTTEGDAEPRRITPTGRGAQVMEGPEDKLKTAAEDVFRPHWPDILAAAECMNFGHWTQEVTWDRVDALIAPTRFNSFRPWEIVLVPDAYNDFAGFKLGNDEVDARYAFHCIHEEHRSPLLGHARLQSAYQSAYRMVRSHENGDRGERKATGIQMMIGIPPGMTMAGADGAVLSHSDVTQTITNAATSGKTWTYPLFAFKLDALKQNAELAKIKGMSVDSFDHGNTAPAILAGIERRRELAVEIIRAYRRPEREAMEGQFGTKAEAGVHGQVGITDSELVHADILTQFNEQTFDRFLVTNRGPNAAGSMYWRADPLTDRQRQLYETVFAQLLANPIVGPAYEAHIDRRGFMQKSEMPLKPEEDVVEPEPMPMGPGEPLEPEPGVNGNGRMREMEGVKNGDGN